MGRHGVVSADSHMTEPIDLWEERLDAPFRDRAPKVIETPPSEESPRFLFVAEGAPPFPIAGGYAAGRSGKELRDLMQTGYEAARPSGSPPAIGHNDRPGNRASPLSASTPTASRIVGWQSTNVTGSSVD